MRLSLIGVTALLLSGICSIGAPAGQIVSEDDPLVLTHVNVIGLLGQAQLFDQTVIVRGGRIVGIAHSIGEGLTKGLPTMDCTHKFLMPGLWDMHAHLGDESADKEGFLRVLLANGIVGLRVMSDAPVHYRWREELRHSTIPAPRLVIGHFVDDPKLTGQSAREAVREGKRIGADFIKVHDQIPREAYLALMDESKLVGLPVEGHVPKSITPREAALMGQKSIEHLTGIADATPDQAQADELFQLFRTKGTWQCPTLVMRRSHTLREGEFSNATELLQYVKPSWATNWLKMQATSRGFSAEEWRKRKQIVGNEFRLTGQLHKMRVGILAGTDATAWAPFVGPGFSLQKEMELLVEAGFSSIDAITAATGNAARFLGESDQWGTVEAGKIADLVLLEAKPVLEIRNTRRISGVFLHGKFFDRKALDGLLEEAKRELSKN